MYLQLLSLVEMIATKRVKKERWSYNLSGTLDRKLLRLRPGENQIADLDFKSGLAASFFTKPLLAGILYAG